MSDAVEASENILALHVTSERNVWLKFEAADKADKASRHWQLRKYEDGKKLAVDPSLLKTHIQCLVSA